MKSVTELTGGELRMPQRPHLWERLDEEEASKKCVSVKNERGRQFIRLN